MHHILPGSSVHGILQVRILDWVQFSSVAQSCPTFCNPMNCSMPGLPVHHKSQNLLKLMPIESAMPSSHLILCRPLLLLPPIPPSIGVFSNESTLRMRWPKYWSFGFFSSFSSGRSGGLVSPSLSEFSTVYCDRHSRRLWHSQ